MHPVLIVLVTLGATPAFAHTGLVDHGHGLVDGFAHPFTGADHMLAMIAIGMWAVVAGGRALWLWPLSIMGAIALGGFVGHLGFAIPLQDLVLASTVLLLGAFLASGAPVPAAFAGALCSLFAFGHGVAHGIEMPADSAGFAYGLGFVIASLVLLATGLMARRMAAPLLRWGGAGIALAALALMAA